MIRSDRDSERARGRGTLGVLLLALAVCLGAASSAHAEDCSSYPGGVLDGFAGTPAPSQLYIDQNCTIRNYTASNPFGANISFSTQPGQTDERWLVIFDNVVHTGQMSCNAVAGHRIWFVNGSSSGIHANCQNLFIPVEKINKQNPAGQSVVTIGVPFTYLLRIPVLYHPYSGTVIDDLGSPNELHSVTISDDLNETGVDLTYVSHTMYWEGTTDAVPHMFSNVGGLLTFEIDPGVTIPPDAQIDLSITVVLEDTPTNESGTFVNIAKWEFGRLIDDVFYQPLPGEWGISPPLTIAAPKLVVAKTGPATLGRTLNLGQWGDFAVDVLNSGLTDAWGVTVVDQLPDGASGGMCDMTPEVLGVTLAGSPLTEGTDYSLSYAGPPTCELTLTLLDASGPIGPGEHLLIDYRTRLDADSQDGVQLTNVAGATEWFNDDSSNPDRISYVRMLSDGTPGDVDHEDAHTVTVELYGYFFEKSVANLTSAVDPAATAAPGDRLRYTLRLQSTDVPFDDLTFYDDLGALAAFPMFVPGSLALVTLPPGADSSNTSPSGGTNGAGILDVRNLDVAANSQIVVQFDITVDPTLADGTIVLNQADLLSTEKIADSDDPNVNGQSDPDVVGDEDPTQVVILETAPVALVKANTQASASIGVPFSYRITIPETPYPYPMYDVRITDDLAISTADLAFVSVSKVSGSGAWAPVNTGTGTSLVIEDTSVGIDIPAGEQVVIEITVVLTDTPTNVAGLAFTNTATYGFRRIDGNASSALPGLPGTSPPMTIVEPGLTLEKSGPTSMTIGTPGSFTLDVHNAGDGPAWSVTILDRLPDGPSGGTCDATPVLQNVTLGGNPLSQGVDYSLSYAGPATCELTLTLLEAAGPIGPDAHLIVTYQTGLDAGTQNGVTLTNVAGVTEWFSAVSTSPGRRAYTEDLTDGTPAVVDHEDVHAVVVDLPAYYFEKTVANVTSGASPATTAAPGDTLRYTLRFQNTTDVPFTDLDFVDDLDALNTPAAFQAGTLALVTVPAGADTSNTSPNGGSKSTGLIDVRDLTLPGAGELSIVFDITLATTLVDGSVVSDQAQLLSGGVPFALSDDPDVNGQADPFVAGDEDPTRVTIQVPAADALGKENVQATATIGVPFSYRITVPATPYAYPMYDVRILDDLGASSADLRFVSVSKISGSGAWAPVNTGSDTNLVIEDTGVGIDIPAGEQVVIEITVVLEDTPTNVAGLSFTNSADYTYNWVDEDDASQEPGSPGTTAPMTIVEPGLTLEKSGPTSMTVGTPGTFTLDVHNAGDSPAWSVTILDRLPDGSSGGTCDATPVLQSVTLAGNPLSQGVDYSLSYVGPATCELTLTLLEAAGPIGPDAHLIVTYQTELDADTQNGVTLTNVAGTTQWFGAASSATARRTYSEVLTDGTVGVLDHEDAHTLAGLANAPVLFASKAVEILVDGGTPTVVDPGDVLRYTISVTNSGGVAATAVTLTDGVPANTTYVADSTTLNGLPAGQPDAGVFPLVAGLPISSSDLTPPLPGPGAGTISPGGTAVVVFQLQVDAGVPGGTVISNQAVVGSDSLPDLLTDGDGDPSTGPEPTRVVVSDDVVGITKTTPSVQVTRGQLVPYEITVFNSLTVEIPQLSIVDRLPAGFRYVDGSARVDGGKFEPTRNGSELVFTDIGIPALDANVPDSGRRKVVLLLAVGAGVGEGEFVNRAQAFNSGTGNALSGEATATVRVVPDPDFACTDVLGKVFDDANHNGVQDGGEGGLQGVRVASARGLVATTDRHGRFHITCAVVPREDRGSNFVLKLDDRTLPSGYRMTTRAVQVRRATQGKALRFQFGASIHRVVGLDLADAVFEPDTAEMRIQWKPRMAMLLAELEKEPAILRLSYLADVEDAGLVERRVRAIKQEVSEAWKSRDRYPLTIETEVFWRRGGPPERPKFQLPEIGPVQSLLPSVDAGPPGLPSVDAGPPVLEGEAGHAAERHLSTDEPFTRWSQDPKRLETESGDRIEQRQVATEGVRIVKLKDVVPPIRFESGVAKIPQSYIEKLRRTLDEMRHLRNVRLHLVGHADSQPLSPTLSRLYGDNEGLSQERAAEVAEFIQRALSLPPEAISFAWAGDGQPIASNDTPEGRARNRRVEVEVWYDEPEQGVALEEVVVPEEIRRFKVCRTETVCKLRYREGDARRARVRNLIAPLYYADEIVEVPEGFVRQIEQTLHDLRDKRNVTVKFVGFTDDVPLAGAAERIYGTHLALSKARARRVALAVKDALDLPSSAIASDGHGSERPVASNETERGRALNRRVEVEFWHDDPLQELPDEPQMCPDAAGAELVTKVYDPPWGAIPSLPIENGQLQVPAGYAELLRRALADVADRTHPRLRFVGYTGNERLERRTALTYGDDIGLSTARARRAMERFATELGLPGGQLEHEGRGYVQADDVVNAGFLQGDASYVAVQVVYDELAVLDDYENVEITRITRELKPRDALALNLMRITVDGEPIDDPGRSIADIQRCTDVALERADIQFRFDDLESVPRLSVTAQPIATPAASDGTEVGPVRFRMYTNYASFIERSEIRVFRQGQSLQAEPLAVVAVAPDGLATWQPSAESFPGPALDLKYVLRAYDGRGRFDETAPQSLWMVYGKPDSQPASEQKLLAGYGESGPLARNIPLGSPGSVAVHGSGVPAQHQVYVAGAPVPVDEEGNFVAEVLLPSGLHTVEVAVLNEEGNGELFLRDLEFPRSDFFYVALADFTLAPHLDGGAPSELSGKHAPYDADSIADGRLAFYLNGKLGDDWKLTASADTREEPVEDLFTNFLDKSPDSLFRRIDPDYHYPTFGDDSSVEEMAPTQGKFFARLSKDESHALWGNFEVRYLDNELAQVDRGLYGGNLHYQSLATTSQGEERVVLDGFAAEPGTVPARDEFRGTSGSLYYLRRQDLLQGSERLWIELRDKDSGLVTGVVHLRADLDYDIDWLQGRVLLTEPIPATVGDQLLVRSGGLSGSEAWLVVQYEYTPGFDELNALAAGGQGHLWLTDFARIGVTANRNEEGDDDSTLYAADLTLRASSESWLKVQAGRSEGLVSTALSSDDGGFNFVGTTPLALAPADANAYRADVSVGVADFLEGGRGHLSLYAQRLEAGYSAPGMAALNETDQIGGVLGIPLTDQLDLTAKADWRVEEDGLEIRAEEVDLAYALTEHWSIGTGVRNELREDDSPVVVGTQEEGERTDAVVQVGFDPKGRWRGYAFGQGTVQATEDREDNHRGGIGGSYRINDQLLLDGEVSHGNLGPAVKLGTSYQQDEQTRRYISYAYENERAYNGMHERRGTLISGVKTRMSDSSSVYLEDRYQHGDSATGLLRAMGMSLAPTDRWSLSANWELGSLFDMRTYAETKRRAGGARVGYGVERLQLSSGIEYRYDETEQLDGTWDDRTTWLFRNSFRFQVTPSGRVVAKFNHSFSDSSLGDFYDGGYTEAVAGYAFRPVQHDRLDALLKYTYLYNVPTTDQLSLQNTPALYIQKSHVASVDVTYDLTKFLSIGGKYAYRLGQVSLDRENPDFFDNNAHLVILRADLRVLTSWELSAEGRMLDLPDVNDRRAGGLFTVYRYLGDHFKVGVGYNFTDFSDDLTDLSYDHHGVFFNLVGSM